MTDATDIREWPKSSITHKPLPAVVEKTALPAPQDDRGNHTKRIFTPMKPAEKRKGRASDTFDLKHNTSDKRFLASGTPTGDVPSTAVISASRPAGCKWSNNSCPFDSTLFVVYNLWRIDPAAWTVAFNSFGNQWLDILAESFNKHIEKLYTLEEVKDYVRRKMHREYPRVFVFGQEMSVEAVMMKWSEHKQVFAEVDLNCDRGHSSSQSSQYCCTLQPTSTGRLPWSALQQYIDNTSSTPLTYQGSQCSDCGNSTGQCCTYKVAPPFVTVLAAFTPAPPDPVVHLMAAGERTEYRLAGVVYYGTHHFTARFVDPQGQVWFNDGIATGRHAVLQGLIDDMDMSVDKSGKERDVFVYHRADI
ncbi:uncharacterized protein ARMOST_16659 [Armillaria ostoyae]|uniref:USP domain-containing protein n=1 Tax=Armillaria ostoyae TaxID=47428 RepID=A0A284RWV1_ARMOS|nr:uncharacterized protein ARMOST_16659 [Armillaria ostoyae]